MSGKLSISGSYDVATRKGSDGTNIYCCTLCRRLEVSSYDGWLYHIATREHQVALSKSPTAGRWRREAEYRNRCVTVHGIRGITASEVLEYLKDWGEIEDFLYLFVNKGENGVTNHCLCLYREKKAALACLDEPSHECKGQQIGVYKKLATPFVRTDRSPRTEEARGSSKRKMESDEVDEKAPGRNKFQRSSDAD